MMTLRPAREEDVPALIELVRRSWLSGFAPSAPAAFVQQRLARDFERDWYPRHWPAMTVAEDGGVLLGLVQPEGDEVNGLWVAPEAQGRGVFDSAARGERIVLVAEDAETGRVVGTLQVILAMPDNQPHRADVAKMLVRRDARRRGLGAELMRAAESAA